jgi:peptidoglycan/xylan/chitin deacetylase (PgdA/CDA1 family)
MKLMATPVIEQPVPRTWSWRQLARRALTAALPRKRFLVHGPRSSNALCLTFDDGPHPEHTPALLDVLRTVGVHATFFLIGQNVERYSDVVRRLTEEGHEVGHHSFSHSEPRDTSASVLLQELERTQALLTEITGAPSKLFRPPHGKVTAAKLWRLWRAGQSIVLWNRDPKDWACKAPAQVQAWFERHPLQGGDIILLHDNHPHAAAILPDLAARVRAAGLTFTTAGEWTI